MKVGESPGRLWRFCSGRSGQASCGFKLQASNSDKLAWVQVGVRVADEEAVPFADAALPDGVLRQVGIDLVVAAFQIAHAYGRGEVGTTECGGKGIVSLSFDGAKGV